MATNSEIIYTAAVNAGIYTAEQATAIIMTGAALPIHTFIEWKRLGYSVKKGEKAALRVDLWNYTTKPSKAAREQAAAEGKELAEDPHYYLKLAHLFTLDQVKRIDTNDNESEAAAVEQPAPAQEENTADLDRSATESSDTQNETPAPGPSANPMRDIRIALDEYINNADFNA